MALSGVGKPLRTCVVCKRESVKAELLRFSLRLNSNSLVCDLSQTAEGRGAYVHASLRCLCSYNAGEKLLRSLNKVRKIKGSMEFRKEFNLTKNRAEGIFLQAYLCLKARIEKRTKQVAGGEHSKSIPVSDRYLSKFREIAEQISSREEGESVDSGSKGRDTGSLEHNSIRKIRL